MIRHVNIKSNSIKDKKGILQQFLNEAKKYPPLTREQERFANRDLLIKHNMLFAVSVAFRYDNAQCDIMDLISEAMLGLIKAADTYNPKVYNVKFIRYALFQIQRYIKEFLDTKKNFVRLPHLLVNIRYNAGKHEETDVHTLAKKLKVKEHFVESALSIKGFVSLDDTDEDGESIYQIASDSETDSDVLRNEKKQFCNEITECLNEREYKILQLRYLSDYPKNWAQVSEEMNICQERVRQLEKQAFKKIRDNYEIGS